MVRPRELNRFRLIPAIDEWGTSQAIVASPVGKFTLATLAAFFLCSFRFELNIFYFFVAFFAVFSPLKKEWSLVILLTLGWLTMRGAPVPSMLYENFNPEQFSQVFLGQTIPEGWPLVAYRFVVLSLVLLLALVLGRGIPRAIFYVLAAALLLLLPFLPRIGYLGLFVWSLAIIFLKGIGGWFFASEPGARLNLSQRLSLALQFMGTGYASPLFRSQEQFADTEQLARVRLKGVKILVWSSLINLGNDFLTHYFFGHGTIFPFGQAVESLAWPQYMYPANSLVVFNQAALPVWKIWSTMLLITFNFTFQLAAFTGFYIGIARLLGFYLPRAVCRPYLAHSFNEYFRRYFYYYSELLLHLFYIPFWRAWEAPRRFRAAKIVVVAVLAIGFGGWVVHIARWGNRILYFGAEEGWRIYFGFLPYFILLGLLTGLSGLRSSAQPAGERKLQPLRFFCFFVVHSLLLVFFAREPGWGMSEKWIFYRSLLGL